MDRERGPPLIRPYDAWVVSRLIAGLNVEGGLEAVSRPLRSLVDHLDALPTEVRQTALGGFLCSPTFDRALMIEALAAMDPEGSAPESVNGRVFATLADIARVVSDQSWLWRDWIARGVLNVVASEPGTGKTRFGLDLARRLWFGLPMPDGQSSGMPEGTRTLWVQGDRNFAEMLQAARDFGLPDDSVALGSSPDDPTGGLDMDDPEALASLGERIEAAASGLVVIDTVGMVTDRNLCRPEEARAFFAPIIDLAGQTGIAFLGLTHLSKDKEALGRRIVEKARVVIKMTQPDPEGQKDRRRLWVDKSAVVKPPPLGVTIAGRRQRVRLQPPDRARGEQGGPPAGEARQGDCFPLGEADRRGSQVVRIGQ
jgi:AAA domain